MNFIVAQTKLTITWTSMGYCAPLCIFWFAQFRLLLIGLNLKRSVEKKDAVSSDTTTRTTWQDRMYKQKWSCAKTTVKKKLNMRWRGNTLLWTTTTEIYAEIYKTYTAKLLFHQSPTRPCHYTMTGQWLCCDCWQLSVERLLHCHWQLSHRSAGSCQQSLSSHSIVTVPSRWMTE